MDGKTSVNQHSRRWARIDRISPNRVETNSSLASFLIISSKAVLIDTDTKTAKMIAAKDNQNNWQKVNNHQTPMIPLLAAKKIVVAAKEISIM